jgi:hypothetical protein
MQFFGGAPFVTSHAVVGEYSVGGEFGGMVVIGAVTPVGPDVVGATVGTVVWK